MNRGRKHIAFITASSMTEAKWTTYCSKCSAWSMSQWSHSTTACLSSLALNATLRRRLYLLYTTIPHLCFTNQCAELANTSVLLNTAVNFTSRQKPVKSNLTENWTHNITLNLRIYEIRPIFHIFS